MSNHEEKLVKLEQIMRHLYRNEINCAISCFWDGGWDVKLGDAINKFKAEDNFDTLPECAAWLEARAREFYPKAFEAETPQYECPNFEVTCAGCGKVGGARDYMLEEGDRWECPPCWEKFEAQEKAVCDLKKAIAARSQSDAAVKP